MNLVCLLEGRIFRKHENLLLGEGVLKYNALDNVFYQESNFYQISVNKHVKELLKKTQKTIVWQSSYPNVNSWRIILHILWVMMFKSYKILGKSNVMNVKGE